MAEASRETARDLVLQNKAIAEKKALLEKIGKDGKVTKSQAEKLNLRTKDGKLVKENASSNRARNRGKK